MSRIRMTAANAVLVVFPLLLLMVAVALAIVVTTVAPDGWVNAVTYVVLCGLVAWLVGSASTAVRRRPEPAPGPELTRAAFPELWVVVDEVATLATTAPPARIVLEPGGDAGVLEVAGNRELVLGHGLFAALTVGELRTVLGHEMAHFAHGDTAEPAQLVRTRDFLTVLHESSGFFLGRWLVDLAAWLHLRLSAPARQKAERLADEVAVRAGGHPVAISALLAGQRAELAAERVVDTYLPALRAGPVPGLDRRGDPAGHRRGPGPPGGGGRGAGRLGGGVPVRLPSAAA